MLVEPHFLYIFGSYTRFPGGNARSPLADARLGDAQLSSFGLINISKLNELITNQNRCQKVFNKGAWHSEIG